MEFSVYLGHQGPYFEYEKTEGKFTVQASSKCGNDVTVYWPISMLSTFSFNRWFYQHYNMYLFSCVVGLAPAPSSTSYKGYFVPASLDISLLIWPLQMFQRYNLPLTAGDRKHWNVPSEWSSPCYTHSSQAEEIRMKMATWHNSFLCLCCLPIFVLTTF